MSLILVDLYLKRVFSISFNKEKMHFFSWFNLFAIELVWYCLDTLEDEMIACVIFNFSLFTNSIPLLLV
jgi:hypothetical protein